MNPLGALMMGDNAARYNVPEMRALVDDMAAEVMTVVQVLGGSSMNCGSWPRPRIAHRKAVLAPHHRGA